MIGIYMFENKKTHKKYIGQSTNIERRKEEHLMWPSKHSYFDNELKKIGIDQFNFSILEECDIEELDEREKYWISFYNTYVYNENSCGYNLTLGGQNQRGSFNPGAKLDDNDVKEIIILLEEHRLNNKQIAQLYNVHYNTIDGINRCKHWTQLHNYKTNIRQENLNKIDNPHSSVSGENCATSKIKEEQAIQIIHLLKSTTKPMPQIAQELNVSLNIIYDINRCRTWKYLHNYKKNIRKEYQGGDVKK